jgi:hypothetical protein
VGLFRRWPRRVVPAVVVVGVGAVACFAWIVVARTNALEPNTGSYGRIGPGDLAMGQLVWALQTIAAFPIRDDTAPLIVYALWLVPFGCLVGWGFRHADLRLRLAGLALLAVWVAVPLALTVATYSSEGLAWQGRYALPLAVGFPALAGLALNRGARGPSTATVALTAGACAAAQVISCVRVAWLESDKALAPTFAAGVPGGLVVIALLATAGAMIPLALARGASPTGPPSLTRRSSSSEVHA